MAIVAPALKVSVCGPLAEWSVSGVPSNTRPWTSSISCPPISIAPVIVPPASGSFLSSSTFAFAGVTALLVAVPVVISASVASSTTPSALSVAVDSSPVFVPDVLPNTVFSPLVGTFARSMSVSAIVIVRVVAVVIPLACRAICFVESTSSNTLKVESPNSVDATAPLPPALVPTGVPSSEYTPSPFSVNCPPPLVSYLRHTLEIRKATDFISSGTE